ncbi:MAG: hypothetical protein KAR64_04915 [Thermoplasmatales archaeon]|nr:hypothetical protein [Thermoplasmatales archaeon]
MIKTVRTIDNIDEHKFVYNAKIKDIRTKVLISTSYPKFKKYFSKMIRNDRLSKKGNILIFTITKQEDYIVFSPLRSENDLFIKR